MTRVKRGVFGRKKRKEILKAVKGFRGARRRLYRAAKEALAHALKYSYIHRRTKKRDFRRLWIARISGALTKHEMNYSSFINGLKKAQVELNRKQIANLAVTDERAFDELVNLAKTALSQQA